MVKSSINRVFKEVKKLKRHIATTRDNRLSLMIIDYSRVVSENNVFR